MQTIPLRAMPNQSLSFTLDGNRWEVTVKQAVEIMIANVTINDDVIILGAQLLPGTPVLPYPYLMNFGNLILIVENEQLSDWRRFETDQTLVYVNAADMAEMAQL